ncbi:ATP-binding protein [Temperatibacter marinus]|uniref:histidine kinase n=1 Tax=Temperatibacter marinus TaxID=1456591 RepID=A0AA52EH33_9PROT|nr:ATP-binding protein [Temperatibacter marinus]WND02665.1 ATP-binding protein [Temperatibacter marinus]
MNSIASRLLLSSSIVILLSLSLAGWVISWTFEESLRSDMDLRLRVMLDTMIGVSELGEAGELRFNRPVLDQRFDEPFSGFYWQISEVDTDPFRSRSLWDQALELDLSKQALRGRFSGLLGPEEQQLRSLQQDIILPESDRIFRYVVALDTASILESKDRFDRVLNWALLMIGLAILMVIFVQIFFGLRPLHQLGHKLRDVRSGRRPNIEGQFPAEIDPMVQEINELISYNKTVLERARTHVGNLAHALKTPLTVLKNEAGNSDKPVNTHLLSEQVNMMQNHVSHHLRRARVAGRMSGGGISVSSVLTKLKKAMKTVFHEKEFTITVDIDPSLLFAGEQEDLTEIVGVLLENACKYGGEEIYISTRSLDTPSEMDREMFQLIVEDNGAGIPEDAFEELFKRGQRLDTQTKGSGLGLSIVQDVVELYGGHSHASKSEYGGLKIYLTLPKVS